MGLFKAFEYYLSDFSFRYHASRYNSLKKEASEKARVHLKKAIDDGEALLKVGGYFPASDREVLSSLEREAARISS